MGRTRGTVRAVSVQAITIFIGAISGFSLIRSPVRSGSPHGNMETPKLRLTDIPITSVVRDGVTQDRFASSDIGVYPGGEEVETGGTWNAEHRSCGPHHRGEFAQTLCGLARSGSVLMLA